MDRIKGASLLVFTLAALGLAACESGSSSGPPPVTFTPPPPPAVPDGSFVAAYAPPYDVGPYPNDIYNPTGTRVQVPERVTNPLASAVNTLDGFSTTAPISVPFNAPVDPASLVPFDPLRAPTGKESVFVLNATAGQPLVPGVDYTVRVSSAAGGEGIVEIVPLRPLAPRTRYAFVLTSNVRSRTGAAASADAIFRAVRDAHLAGLTSVPEAPQLAPLFPAITPLIDTARNALGLPGESISVAFSMLTQSIDDVLTAIEQTATPRTAALVSAGITTAQLGMGLPGLADIYTGYLEVPYFGDPANPLDSFWVNASLEPPNVNDPVPVPRVANQRIPLLATLPNATSGHSEPPNGWPVVVFQHGITLNRTMMLAMADAFAQAGFAAVAIDLPLHGITDPQNPFYQGPGSPFGNNERHFNRDAVGPTGVFAPDGKIDDGWQILNVRNPLNGRDHLRQAVSDTIHLVRTLPVLNFPDGDAAPDLDGSRIHYVGISLGSIISGVFLGVNADVRTATLSSPAGPWSAILTDPQAHEFGGPIRAALSAQGLPPGTVNFDNFVRDLQTVIDSVDPVNYAAAASLHPLHVIEVRGDAHVPNGPSEHLASLWGIPTVSSTVAATPPATVSGLVRFVRGGHSSMFNAAIDPAVTVEMQRQAVVFASSDGSVIEITDTGLVE